MARVTARERIIDTAMRLFSRRGYAAVGLNEIVERSGAPKGSLYHHFPGGKTEIAAAAMRQGAAMFVAELSAALRAAPDVAAAIGQIGRILAGWLEQSAFRDGCPITAVTVEMSAYDETVRLACRDGYAAWTALLEEALAREGLAAAEAQSLSCWIVASIEGGIVLTRAHASRAPLLQVIAELERTIAARVAAAGGRG